MIPIRGIDHAAIHVKDLEKSKAFYTQILGLQVSARERQKPGVEYFLDCGSSLIGLIQGRPEGDVHKLQDEGFGVNHIAFGVKTQDFDRCVEELKSQGVTIVHSKKREKSWSVYFLDPDGNKLELTAWPHEDQLDEKERISIHENT